MSTNLPARPDPGDRIKAVIERRNEWPGYRERPISYPEPCASTYPAEVVEHAAALLHELEGVASVGWDVTPDDWREVADLAELSLELLAASARRRNSERRQTRQPGRNGGRS